MFELRKTNWKSYRKEGLFSIDICIGSSFSLKSSDENQSLLKIALVKVSKFQKQSFLVLILPKNEQKSSILEYQATCIEDFLSFFLEELIWEQDIFFEIFWPLAYLINLKST